MNLNAIPTPLTDAAVAKSGFMGEEKVTADFARRLERERYVLLRVVEAVEQSFKFRDVVRANGCPVCFCIKSWDEDHKEDCLIGQALTLTAPTES